MIKSVILIFLSTLLVAAIMAPSVVTILDIDSKSWNVMELNDDENQTKNQKDLNEKDVFFYLPENVIAYFISFKPPSNSFYVEKGYSYTPDIFLPPPKRA